MVAVVIVTVAPTKPKIELEFTPKEKLLIAADCAVALDADIDLWLSTLRNDVF